MEVMGVGVEMEGWLEELVMANEVEAKVRLAMESEQGKKLRDHVEARREATAMTWKDGGLRRRTECVSPQPSPRRHRQRSPHPTASRHPHGVWLPPLDAARNSRSDMSRGRSCRVTNCRSGSRAPATPPESAAAVTAPRRYLSTMTRPPPSPTAPAAAHLSPPPAGTSSALPRRAPDLPRPARALRQVAEQHPGVHSWRRPAAVPDVRA
ncbi:hypothetical protein DAI22_10g007900 [Oryza sativa Japonica Group]|nr:hypothetical protein DAI22_10g007900 [Oryza sativa Japonica Group]